MVRHIKLDDIYDKNINFLIGSGASVGLFPTLAVDVKSDTGESQTIESLATNFESKGEEDQKAFLFLHYFKNCIKPVMSFDVSSKEIKDNSSKLGVVDNYRSFLRTILTVLERKKQNERRCNVFTTNYDGCIPFVADDIQKSGAFDFIMNDGTRGFSRRHLQAKNYNSFVYQTGIFERNHSDIPQINFIPLHGSVYWEKHGGEIIVDYSKRLESCLIDKSIEEDLKKFSEVICDSSKILGDIPKTKLDSDIKASFWDDYNKLPIVNPTKWKFHETVFEEHYYQMLRLLSYELEKPNSVFITFGFSFADEHILNLVRRSLSNPGLQVFICCFNEGEVERMKRHFSLSRNVEYVCSNKNLDFSAFNKDVFTLNPPHDSEE